ncbi:MAG: two-component system, chemotaxis family, protein-glutamate methylesterase/glutaminase [Moorella sp. (in: firmicutes)]|nr:two-component system, chemotaxis family, protein-glutamate methylesterase/glutaminase [Moorella sp. (in: firmicutes)]
MNWPVRVLVVDDSAFSRRLVTDILQADPAIQVVGYARDGREALEKVASLQPRVVTLDQEMPVLDGLATLTALMSRNPVAVIMLSSHTAAGAAVTIKALELGAVDFIPKPAPGDNLDDFTRQLTEKVKAAARAPVTRLYRGKPCRENTPAHFISPSPGREEAAAAGTWSAAATAAIGSRLLPGRSPGGKGGAAGAASAGRSQREAIRPGKGTPAAITGAVASGAGRLPGRRPGIEVVAIGTSTGGPAALRQVLTALPGNLPAGIVIVQHMPAGFTGPLARRLDELAALEVREAAAGDILRPGLALLAPAGRQMLLERHGGAVQVHLAAEAGITTLFKPSVDALFLTVAREYGPRSLGVILTGMGNDGLRGLRAIKEQGGTVIAQDEATSVVYGMPRAAVEAGLADLVLPLEDIAPAIVALVTGAG